MMSAQSKFNEQFAIYGETRQLLKYDYLYCTGTQNHSLKLFCAETGQCFG